MWEWMFLCKDLHRMNCVTKVDATSSSLVFFVSGISSLGMWISGTFRKSKLKEYRG